MISKNLIQASANVIRVTKLVKGDVLKLVKDNDYGDKIKFAIVLDVMNDGEQTFVELLVYKTSYDSVEGELIILGGDNKDYSIFPTTKEEMDADFGKIIEQIKDDIKNKEEEIAKKTAMLKKTEQFVNGELSKKLTTPEFKEMTQTDYSAKKQLL